MKTYLSSLLLGEQTYFQFPSLPVHQRRNQRSWRIHISGKSMYSLNCSQFHTEFLQWMSIHYGSTYHNCHTELLCGPLEQHHCKDHSQLYSLYNTKLLWGDGMWFMYTNPIIGYVSVTLTVLSSWPLLTYSLFPERLKSDRHMSMCMTRPTKLHVHPAKTQISLCICTQWEAKDPCILHADCEDWSDWANAQADPSLPGPKVHCACFAMLWLTW